MLVYPSRQVTQGAVVFGMLALTACTDPTLRTDLRPDGPPNVLAVLVQNDTLDGLVETATFCRLNDDKRPDLVGAPAGSRGSSSFNVCDDDLSVGATEVEDALPANWYARIMFDELLNPSVEDLVDDLSGDGTSNGSLLNTQPATLQCAGVAVPYDGYYAPNGNRVTSPLGPSLVIAPLDPDAIPSGSECLVGIKPNKVFDKQGIAVPEDELTGYKFKTAPLSLSATAPAAPAVLTDATKIPKISKTAPLSLTFNAAIDSASLSLTEVTILTVATCDANPATGLPVVPKIAANTKDKKSISISDTAAAAMEAWVPGKTYLVTFAADAEVTDKAGAVFALADAELKPICFSIPATTP